MRLVSEQLDYFDDFGYLAFPGLLADSIEWITDEFERVFPTFDGITPHDGTKRTCIVPFIDQRERLCGLIDDPRIEGILSSLLGDDFNYMSSDGNYYTGDTPWHPDGAHRRYRHVKIAFYLDPLTRDTGCLRVVPGTHRLGDPYADEMQKKVPRHQESWGIQGRDVPAVALEVKPGDLVVFNHNLLHSSWGGSLRRRMFTINACQRYAEADGGELREYINGLARFWVDRAFGPTMIATAGPGRVRHLEQPMRYDDQLKERSTEARRSTTERARS